MIINTMKITFLHCPSQKSKDKKGLKLQKINRVVDSTQMLHTILDVWPIMPHGL